MPEPRAAKPAAIEFSKIDFGKRFREEYNDIEDLQRSIALRGLIQSLMVLPTEGGRYMLIAGGRRYVALKSLKNAGVDLNKDGERTYLKDIYKDEKIPCLLGWPEMTMFDIRSCELEENIQRQNLSPIEQAKLIKEIHDLRIRIHGQKTSTAPDAEGWSAALTAKLIGKTPSYVSQALDLARHTDIVPDLEEASTWREAKKMVRKANADLEREITLSMVKEGLTEKSLDERRKAIDNWYVVGDFFEKSKQLADRSADLIEIDPPFGIDLKKVKRSEDEILDPYNEWATNQYMEKINMTLDEAWRIAKDDSWLIFWFAPEPWFEKIFAAIKKKGWWLRRMPALWIKNSGQTNRPSSYLGSAYEMFFYAAKGNPVLNAPGRLNIFPCTPIHQDKKTHPTAKPVPLYEDIFETFMAPDHRAVVPFLGSGNQLLALANSGRAGVGFDLGKEYKDKYTFRIYSQEIGKFS